MHTILCLSLALLSVAAAGPIHGRFERRQTPSKGAVPGDKFVDQIGTFMSYATPLSGYLGIDIKGDMTTTLCKTFESTGFLATAVSSFAGSPNGNGPNEKCMKDNTGGSGPYKSKIIEDSALANHTIYVPALPLPTGVKVPVIVWSNGFCLPAGTMFANFLSEIASYGFVVLADGPINHNGNLGRTTKASSLIQSLDWVTGNNTGRSIAHSLDTSAIAVAGQSCGGVNVYGAARDPRVKVAVLFNSGDFPGEFGPIISDLKKPIAYFEGGSKDFATTVGKNDYDKLPAKAAGLFADTESSHIGTYYQMGGGKFGKAAVKFFQWTLKNDQASKAEFCGDQTKSSVASLGFKIQTKNNIC